MGPICTFPMVSPDEDEIPTPERPAAIGLASWYVAAFGPLHVIILLPFTTSRMDIPSEQ